MALTNKLSAIGDAIRSKNGETGKYTLEQMATKITEIQTGSNSELIPSVVPSYVFDEVSSVIARINSARKVEMLFFLQCQTLIIVHHRATQDGRQKKTKEISMLCLL